MNRASGGGELTLIKEESAEWLAAQSPPNVMTAKEIAAREAVIAGELFKLRVAYPTQARNYSEAEVAAMNALWREIFVPVEPRLLHEAIIRFIVNDRKAFFPSPGQIVGVVEQIMAEKQAEQVRIADERHWERVRADRELVQQGQHCGTCRYCRHEHKQPSVNELSYMDWQLAESEEERLALRKEVLFCENHDSPHFIGEHNWGTSREKRCALYEAEGGAVP